MVEALTILILVVLAWNILCKYTKFTDWIERKYEETMKNKR